MNSRLTITFDPLLSSMISLRASQEKESDVQGFVSKLLRVALDSKTKTKSGDIQAKRVAISPTLQSFVGIAKPTDNKEWKERKENYLTEKFKM